MSKRMKHIIRKKLGSSRGETITETLVSLLIITLAMTMLAGSIVTAARINRKVKDTDTSFQVVDKNDSETGSFSDSNVTLTGSSTSVTVYTTTNGYVYYTPVTPAPAG